MGWKIYKALGMEKKAEKEVTQNKLASLVRVILNSNAADKDAPPFTKRDLDRKFRISFKREFRFLRR